MSNLNLRIMNRDGSQNREFFKSSHTKVGVEWSPNGEKILFAAINPETRDGDIMIINEDGTDVLNLTKDLTGTSTSPSWSPDGSKIIFVNKPDADGQEDIYTMDINGGHKTLLTNTAFKKRGPVYTPNGKVIIYVGSMTDDDPVHLYAISTENPKINEIGHQLTHGDES
jgi:Tol biopolymer transport system component